MSFLYYFYYTGDKISQLQKVVGEYSFDISQLQARLDAVQREKLSQQSKALEQERMHVQMKHSVTAEIDYLRKLTFQFVEQQMKGMYTALHTPPHIGTHLKAFDETNPMIPISPHTLTLHTPSHTPPHS